MRETGLGNRLLLLGEERVTEAAAGLDPWAAWLVQRRHGGDPEELARTLEHLVPIRDSVIQGARIAAGDTVLDVGCGDGLITFAAAQQVGSAGGVIFSDVSIDLLQRCKKLVGDIGLNSRCQFVQARASDLSQVPDVSVDAVTLRSVLIYEPDKAGAFREFHRVLRPGGRLSLFEPINSFGAADRGLFVGCPTEPVAELVAKVRAVFDAIQPPSTDPMLDFDERDLLTYALDAGFVDVSMRHEVEIGQQGPTRWDTVLNTAGNPRIPTLGEAMNQALDHHECDRLTGYLRPLIESGRWQKRRAVAFLTANRQ
jgi:SAM-dependent methyltransferase